MRCVGGVLGIAFVVAWLFALQPLQSHSKRQAVPASLQVILKPGKVYTLRFDKPLPVSGNSEQVSFSIETPSQKASAKKVRVDTKGLEIKPQMNRTGARLFLVPEGKEKILFVVPLDRCPAPPKQAFLSD